MADESDDRWTVRGVPKGARDAAAAAAQRRKVTIGAWLSRAVDREIAAEHEPLEMQVFGPLSATSAELSAADARLALIERTVATMVSLATAPGVPTGFRRRANRLLRESLPEPTPRAVAQRDGTERRLRVADATQAGLLNGAASMADHALEARE